MKKIRIMILSLAVVAIVGGALAFKVKGDDQYCTTAWDSIAQECAFENVCPFLDNVEQDPRGIPVCTTFTNGNPAAPCAGVVDCLKSTTLSINN